MPRCREPPAKTIRVLVVAPSAVTRAVLAEILGGAPGVEVVGTAAAPSIARTKLKRLEPDVIAFDLEAPRGDGLDFLKGLLCLCPTPTVVLSSQDAKGAVKALHPAAVVFVTKPNGADEGSLRALGDELLAQVRAAVRSKLRRPEPRPPPLRSPQEKHTIDELLPVQAPRRVGAGLVVCVGASTGGTQALESLFRRLPAGLPGVVVVQHMPKAFTNPFAERLDGVSPLRIAEARSGDLVRDGQALIAPGDAHLLLQRSGAGYKVELRDGPPVNRHRPSVDVLFRSAANCAGRNALGVILTGMGDDGARGLKDMRDAGAATIAQDEASCVVFGMPKAAIELGGASTVASLERIPALIERWSQGRRGSKTP